MGQARHLTRVASSSSSHLHGHGHGHAVLRVVLLRWYGVAVRVGHHGLWPSIPKRRAVSILLLLHHRTPRQRGRDRHVLRICCGAGGGIRTVTGRRRRAAAPAGDGRIGIDTALLGGAPDTATVSDRQTGPEATQNNQGGNTHAHPDADFGPSAEAAMRFGSFVAFDLVCTGEAEGEDPVCGASVQHCTNLHGPKGLDGVRGNTRNVSILVDDDTDRGRRGRRFSGHGSRNHRRDGCEDRGVRLVDRRGQCADAGEVADDGFAVVSEADGTFRVTS